MTTENGILSLAKIKKEPTWHSVLVISPCMNSLKANLLHCKNSDFSNLGASPEV